MTRYWSLQRRALRLRLVVMGDGEVRDGVSWLMVSGQQRQLGGKLNCDGELEGGWKALRVCTVPTNGIV